MQRSIILFVQVIHIEAMFKKELGAFGGIFFVCAELMSLAASFGSENSIMQGCSALSVFNLQDNSRTPHQESDHIYQTEIASLGESRPSQLRLIVDIAPFLIQVLNDGEVSLSAGEVKWSSLLDIFRLQCHLRLFN